MKKIVHSALVLLLTGTFAIFYSTSVQAQSAISTSSFTATVYPILNTSKVLVSVNKKFGKRFHLSVRDEKNDIMITKSLSRRVTQFCFNLNLIELQSGRYSIDLSDGEAPTVSKIIEKERTQLALPITGDRVVCVN